MLTASGVTSFENFCCGEPPCENDCCILCDGAETSSGRVADALNMESAQGTLTASGEPCRGRAYLFARQAALARALCVLQAADGL